MNKVPSPISSKLIGYQRLMGLDEWARLHPAIQKRFSTQLNQKVVYKGIMKEVYLSSAGKLLAQCCRLIGNPLALYSAKSVPVEVRVYPNEKLNGMTWDRFYQYENHAVNRVKSTKCKMKNDQLVEMVGFGFGMELEVFEENHKIVFESHRFFWNIGKISLSIPDWLSPGKTIVSQRALDNEQFEFKLDVTHSLLGKVFKQSGIFKAL